LTGDPVRRAAVEVAMMIFVVTTRRNVSSWECSEKEIEEEKGSVYQIGHAQKIVLESRVCQGQYK
jgi:hypothetical protein